MDNNENEVVLALDEEDLEKEFTEEELKALFEKGLKGQVEFSTEDLDFSKMFSQVMTGSFKARIAQQKREQLLKARKQSKAAVRHKKNKQSKASRKKNR